MSPCRKALCDVRLYGEYEEAAHGSARDRQCNGRNGAGAHEGDDEEGDEEYKRRAEVAQQTEDDNAQCREYDENDKVSGAEKTLKRRRTDVDICDLDNLGGLERKGADFYPERRTISRLTGNEVQRKESERNDRNGDAHGLCAVEVTQPPAHDEEQHYADKDLNDLTEHLVGNGGGYDRKPHGGQEKCYRLDLEARAPYAAHGKRMSREKPRRNDGMYLSSEAYMQCSASRMS